MESGLWTNVRLECVFDPRAISLENGGLLEGEAVTHD